MNRPALPLALLPLASALPPLHAAESLEFVGEHLPETAADNRYGAMPLATAPAGRGHLIVQSGYSSTESQQLRVAGRQLAIGYHFPLRGDRSLEAVAFADALSFSGGNTEMPLDVLFSDDIPLTLPATAEFGRLDGTMEHSGLGIFVDRPATLPCIGAVHLAYGAIIEEYRLSDYRAPYRIVSGPDAGTSGVADYSASYRFFTPMLQLARNIHAGNWVVSPRTTIALPLPRRGVEGRLTGPGFDISGNTADNGEGRHYGDFSLTLGLTLGYRPWRLGIDLGGLISQALLEPIIHKGIERNHVVSLSWRF